MALNETITQAITQVTAPSIPLWISILALFGIIFLIQTLVKSGINIVYAGAYVYGFFKYLREKWKRRKHNG